MAASFGLTLQPNIRPTNYENNKQKFTANQVIKCYFLLYIKYNNNNNNNNNNVFIFTNKNKRD